MTNNFQTSLDPLHVAVYPKRSSYSFRNRYFKITQFTKNLDYLNSVPFEAKVLV